MSLISLGPCYLESSSYIRAYITIEKLLDGSSNSISDSTSEIELTHLLDSQLIQNSNTESDITVEVLLAGRTENSSIASGDLEVTCLLEGVSSGSVALTAQPILHRGLQGSSSSESNLESFLMAFPPDSLSGLVRASKSSEVFGAIQLGIELAGLIEATSGISAIATSEWFSQELSQGVSETLASLNYELSFSGLVSSNAAVTAALSHEYELAGDSNALSSAEINEHIILAGVSTGQATAVGYNQFESQVKGVSSSNSDTVASLFKISSLSGRSSGIAEVDGLIFPWQALKGRVVSLSQADAIGNLAINAVGISNCETNVEGSLLHVRFIGLEGIIDAESDVVGSSLGGYPKADDYVSMDAPIEKELRFNSWRI